MATIEKEKALDVVRQMVADGQVSQEVAEKYFPELKSEDEMIRKELLGFHKDAVQSLQLQEREDNAWSIEQHEKFIAWLEKQKHVEWSEEDEKMRKTAISLLTHPIVIKNNEGARKGVVEWLEHLAILAS